MGEHIVSHLISLLNGTNVPGATSTQLAGQSNDSGQEVEIDEEAGDPKRLSRGYVFVRKRDLD